jgi:hypothetical protein
MVFLTEAYRFSFLKVGTAILRYWRKIQAFLKAILSEGREGKTWEH